LLSLLQKTCNGRGPSKGQISPDHDVPFDCDMLIWACILAGCDYAPGIRRVGFVRAVDSMRQCQSFAELSHYLKCACGENVPVNDPPNNDLSEYLRHSPTFECMSDSDRRGIVGVASSSAAATPRYIINAMTPPRPPQERSTEYDEALSRFAALFKEDKHPLSRGEKYGAYELTPSEDCGNIFHGQDSRIRTPILDYRIVRSSSR